MQTVQKNKSKSKTLEKQKPGGPLKRGRPRKDPTKVMRIPVSLVTKVLKLIEGNK